MGLAASHGDRGSLIKMATNDDDDDDDDDAADDDDDDEDDDDDDDDNDDDDDDDAMEYDLTGMALLGSEAKGVR